MEDGKDQLLHLLQRLWGHLSRKRRWQFGVLLLLMVSVSFSEILSIGAVLPFLGVLTAPERVFYHPSVQPLVHFFGWQTPAQLLFPFTVFFCLAAVIGGGMRLVMLWVNTRVSYATGADLSMSIYRRTLYQPYSVHVGRNSSEVINGISSKASIITHVIVQMMSIVSGTIMLVAILVAMVAVNPLIAITSVCGFGMIYVSIVWITKKRQVINGECVARESSNVIKCLQEGLGGIRDVLIDGCQDAYCDIYRAADAPMRRALGNSLFIGQSPRFAMEALGMILIAALAYFLAQQPDGIGRAIPVLGAIALGAQRLLPVLQLGYSAWSSVLGTQASLRDALDLLDQPLPAYADEGPAAPLRFQREILVNALAFRYAEEAPWVLKGVQLVIPKGARVGFIGATGSGKSTLLDIFMGLLFASKGTIQIDGVALTGDNFRSWQAHIAHVPQAIYLADSTIEENIAFGIPKTQIDRARVCLAARQAQIASDIESWENGYETMVGERGIRLSGGQRQRIGIARALYKQADVIIFDEATSALDNATELAVMEAVETLSKDLTILMIAHRLTTLKKCSLVVELEDGVVGRMGSYEEIVERETEKKK